MKDRKSLPFADWPEADTALFAALFHEGSLLDGSGPFVGYTAASRRTLNYGYAYWLGWLAQKHPEALTEPPIVRATPERLLAWVEDRSDLQPASRLSLVVNTLTALMAAAPYRDWTVQRLLLNRLDLQASRQTSTRKDDRILHAAVVFDAGLKLMVANGMGAPPRSLAEARARRDGALMAFLIVLPMRRRACCGIELGLHLRGSGPWHLTLTSDLMKMRQPWSATLPDLLDPILTDYLTHVRPFLAARDRQGRADPALWLNDQGIRLAPNTMTGRITDSTRRTLGVAISPHLFRDIAATTLAHESPDASRVTRSLLGHTGFQMAERHYNHATNLEAGRRYADLMRSFKPDTALPLAPAPALKTPPAGRSSPRPPRKKDL